MSRPQKAYTIRQYNKARVNRGEEPIPNPFSSGGNDENVRIVINADGTETITPKPDQRVQDSIVNYVNRPGTSGVTRGTTPGTTSTTTTSSPNIDDDGIDDFTVFPDAQDVDAWIAGLTESQYNNLFSGQDSSKRAKTKEGGYKRKEPDVERTTPSTSKKQPISLSDFDEAGKSDSQTSFLDKFYKSQEIPAHAPDIFDKDTQPIEDMASQTRATDGGSGTPMQVSATGATTGAQGSSGGFDSMQGPMHYIPRPLYNYGAGHMRFRKVHHMKSYAIPFKTLDYASGSFTKTMITTPMVEIPWDKPYLYCSEEEFNLSTSDRDWET